MPRSIKDAIASGELKTFMDRRLIEALGHPVREHVLSVLNERPSSASEIGREIDVDVADFYHHVEALEKRGFLEVVESRRGRGSRERVFVAKEAVFFDDVAWGKVPATVRSDIVAGYVRLIVDEIVSGLRGGAFRAASNHTSWIPGVFDSLGWQECMALMEDTMTRMKQIQKRSSKRIAVSGEPGIPGTVAMLGYLTTSILRRTQPAG